MKRIDFSQLERVVGGRCDPSGEYAANPTSSARGVGPLTSSNRLSILGAGKRERNDGRALAFRRRKGWY